MKNLQKIREITNKAIEDIKVAKEKERLTAISNKKKKRLQEIKSAKEAATKWLMGCIEEAAKQGKTNYNIDIGRLENGKTLPRTRLEMRYIKKYLGEFNPIFAVENGKTPIYDYEGCSTGEYNHHMALNVSFSW